MDLPIPDRSSTAYGSGGHGTGYRAGRYDPVEALENWGGGEDQRAPISAAPFQRLSIADVVQTGMRKARGIDRTTYRSTNHRINRNWPQEKKGKTHALE